jgi:hypothetical protein
MVFGLREAPLGRPFCIDIRIDMASIHAAH